VASITTQYHFLEVEEQGRARLAEMLLPVIRAGMVVPVQRHQSQELL
jgi:hypothetical protein